MSTTTYTHRLAADFSLRSHGHVDDPPLSAGHRGKEKGLLALFDLCASRLSRQAQFFNPQQPEVVRIKHDQRMILVRQPQHLHRQMLQRQQQLCLVLQQQIRFRTTKRNYYVGVLNVRVGRCPFPKFVIDIDIDSVQHQV